MWSGEVAKRAGVNPQTLRYYERRGILPVPERTSGGFRDYPVQVVNLVRFIKQAQDLGYSLTDVEGLLRLADGGAASCAEARGITAARLADLDRRIAELGRMCDSLAAMGTVCRGLPRRLCLPRRRGVTDDARRPSVTRMRTAGLSTTLCCGAVPRRQSG